MREQKNRQVMDKLRKTEGSKRPSLKKVIN